MRLVDSISGSLFSRPVNARPPAYYQFMTGTPVELSIPGVIRTAVRNAALGTMDDSATCHTSCTPFPLLDAFVGMHIHRGGQKGVVSVWSISAVLDRNGQRVHRVLYQVNGNKYCARIGRPHKSNHVMFEADCSRGVLYQRCWDVDCRGFRSDEIRIPPEAVPPPQLLEEAMLDLKMANHLRRHPEL